MFDMKITRDIHDNGMHIVHAKYTEEERAEAVKKAKDFKEQLEKAQHIDVE